MICRFSYLLIFLINSHLFGATYLSGDYSKNRKIFFEVYQESNFYIVDKFIIKAEDLQERVEQIRFTLKFDLYKYLEKVDARESKHEIVESLSSSELRLANKVIWKVKNKWNLDWEKKYSKWVRENFNESFFIKYNIKTDCADAAIALRWIFARIHFLPAANTLAGSGRLFTHEMVRKKWKNLKTNKNWYEDKLFLKALDYIKDNAYTKTLYKDTYPIEISSAFFSEGLIQLLGGHTKIISRIDYSGHEVPITLLSSTVPTKVRKLYKEYFFDYNNIEKKSGGLVRMRWPYKKQGKWSLISKKKMPGYSEEQFSSKHFPPEESFALGVFKKLEINIQKDKIFSALINGLVNAIESRKEVVLEGYQYCLKNKCEEGTLNYENWSTPSRDKRLVEQYNDAHNIVMNLQMFDPDAHQDFEDRLSEVKVTIQDKEVFLKDILTKLGLKLLSYHPEDKISERWGLTKTDQLNVLKKSTSRVYSKRKKIIDSADICRIDKSNCPNGSSNFNKFLTLKMDNEIKQLSQNVLNFICAHGRCEEEVYKLIKKNLLLYSAPTQSLLLRNGEHIALDQFSIQKIEGKLIEIFPGFFIGESHIYEEKDLEFLPIKENSQFSPYNFYIKNKDDFVTITKDGYLVKANNQFEILEKLSPHQFNNYHQVTTNAEKTFIYSTIQDNLSSHIEIIELSIDGEIINTYLITDAQLFQNEDKSHYFLYLKDDFLHLFNLDQNISHQITKEPMSYENFSINFKQKDINTFELYIDPPKENDGYYFYYDLKDQTSLKINDTSQSHSLISFQKNNHYWLSNLFSGCKVYKNLKFESQIPQEEPVLNFSDTYCTISHSLRTYPSLLVANRNTYFEFTNGEMEEHSFPEGYTYISFLPKNSSIISLNSKDYKTSTLFDLETKKLKESNFPFPNVQLIDSDKIFVKESLTIFNEDGSFNSEILNYGTYNNEKNKFIPLFSSPSYLNRDQLEQIQFLDKKRISVIVDYRSSFLMIFKSAIPLI